MSVQYSCTLCVERTIGSDIGLTHPMELLGDVGLVESCFSPFGDSAIFGPRQVHGLRQTYHRLIHRFNAPMILLGDEAQVEARFSPCRDSANLDAR